MSELDDLPSWAGRNTDASPRRGRRRTGEAESADQPDPSDPSDQLDAADFIEEVEQPEPDSAGAGDGSTADPEPLEPPDQPIIDADETATVEVGGLRPPSEAPTAESSADEVAESLLGFQDEAAPVTAAETDIPPPTTSPRVDLPPPAAAFASTPTIDAETAEAASELATASDEQLPTWEAPIIVDEPTIAARPAAAPPTGRPGTSDGPATRPEEPKRRRGRRALLFLLGLAVIGALAVGGFLLTRESSETAADGDGESAEGTTDGASGDAAADGTTDGEASEGDAGDETEAGGSEGQASEGQASEGTADTDEPSEAPTTVIVPDNQTDSSSPDDAATDGQNQSTREAVFRDGMVYLSGRVPSQEISEIIEQKAAAVVGPDNVVNEYVIDPTVELNVGEATPLYVEDVVLFEFNSVAIAPLFEPILDLGVLLLSQNPQASLVVVTRTDAVGSEEINLEVARQRAQSVINYMVRRGVNPDQITADPRGEEGTSEDDDEQTAALQRRAEFTVIGLLD